MATFDIKMPKMGESVTECTITVLNVKVGDYIEEDTDLFEITSAKTAATIPSPVAGTIVKINYGEGDTVAVGEPVIIVDTSGQAVAPATPAPAAEKEAPAPAATPTPSVPVTEVHRGTVERWYSPVVLERAKAAKVSQEELDKIEGTGFGGRVSKADISTLVYRLGDDKDAMATLATGMGEFHHDRIQSKMAEPGAGEGTLKSEYQQAAAACPIHRRLPVTRSGTTPKMMPNRIVWLR